MSVLQTYDSIFILLSVFALLTGPVAVQLEILSLPHSPGAMWFKVSRCEGPSRDVWYWFPIFNLNLNYLTWEFVARFSRLECWGHSASATFLKTRIWQQTVAWELALNDVGSRTCCGSLNSLKYYWNLANFLGTVF
jgi:hypothetical protein